ncbi:MAG TPA: hypothetical protein VMV58_03260 [Desulfosporosinus sp.]|nr:hypothetical protein [Desulfosporosinus sp.]
MKYKEIKALSKKWNKVKNESSICMTAVAWRKAEKASKDLITISKRVDKVQKELAMFENHLESLVEDEVGTPTEERIKLKINTTQVILKALLPIQESATKDAATALAEAERWAKTMLLTEGTRDAKNP